MREILETYKLAKTDYNSGLVRLRRFVKQGVSHVHFCDLPTSKGEEIVQPRDSSLVTYHPVDVIQDLQVEQMFKKIEEKKIQTQLFRTMSWH